MNPPGDPDDRALRDRLRALRVDPPGDEFAAALHRRLVAADAPRSPSRWLALAALVRAPAFRWPLAGAAAGAAVFLALTLVHPGLPARAPVAAGEATLLPATKVAVLRLTLTAEAPVDGALIRVTLPPELSFWADGRELAQRSFEWTQPLDAGDNEIPIAVRGREPGRYRVAVSARIGEERVEDEIVLEVVGG